MTETPDQRGEAAQPHESAHTTTEAPEQRPTEQRPMAEAHEASEREAGEQAGQAQPPAESRPGGQPPAVQPTSPPPGPFTPEPAQPPQPASSGAEADSAGSSDGQEGGSARRSFAERRLANKSLAQQQEPPKAPPKPKPSEGQRSVDPSRIDVDAEVEQALSEAGAAELVDQSRAQARSGQLAPTDEESAEQPTQADGPKQIEYALKRGRISAIRDQDVFVDLHGMDSKLQGIVPLQQFERAPRVGSILDFVVERVDEEQGLIYLSREGAVTKATWQQLKKGDIVEARVTGSNKGGLELEMVGNIQAFMPASQIDYHHVENLEEMVGQKLKGMVQEIDRRHRKVVLSRRSYLEHEKKMLQQKLLNELEEGQVRQGRIRSLADYGAFVDLGGLDGLVHISDLSYTRIKHPKEVVKEGDTVQVKVLGVDPQKKRIKLGLKQVEPDPWEGVADRIAVGDLVSGRVIRTTNFGAFVEIEQGLEGLLPISEMSWKRINDVSEVLAEGDVVRVMVMQLEPAKRRLTLSLKQAQGDPWQEAEQKYAQGTLVSGKVTRVTDFGAFVEVEPGMEGMVHISELADRRVKNVGEVLQVGDVKDFRVLELDAQNRRLKLSLKAVTAPPPQEEAQAPSKRAKAKRKPGRPLKGGLE